MNKNSIIYIILISFVILTPLKSFAITLNGESPIGLGGAYTAVADDSGAIYMNPAGLAQISQYVVDLSYQTDKRYDSNTWGIAVVDSMSSSLAVGLSYSKNNRDDSQDENDLPQSGNSKVLSDEEELFILSLAEMHSPGVFVGISVKYYQQRSPNGHDYTGDVGLLYYFSEKIKLGLTGRNLIDTKFEENHKLFTGGIAYDLAPSMGISFDLTKDAETQKEKDTIYSFGARLQTQEMVKIRGGYMIDKIENKRYYSFNLDYMFEGYSIGYSIMKDDSDKNVITQIISLKFYNK